MYNSRPFELRHPILTMTTIYHNPRCSKSRQTLALLEERGQQPTVVLYLEHPPSASELRAILAKLNKTPREILRKSEDVYEALNLDDAKLSDADLINVMVENPILIERPIVIKGEKAALGRPPEQVLDIL